MFEDTCSNAEEAPFLAIPSQLCLPLMQSAVRLSLGDNEFTLEYWNYDGDKVWTVGDDWDDDWWDDDYYDYFYWDDDDDDWEHIYACGAGSPDLTITRDYECNSYDLKNNGFFEVDDTYQVYYDDDDWERDAYYMYGYYNWKHNQIILDKYSKYTPITKNLPPPEPPLGYYVQQYFSGASCGGDITQMYGWAVGTCFRARFYPYSMNVRLVPYSDDDGNTVIGFIGYYDTECRNRMTDSIFTSVDNCDAREANGEAYYPGPEIPVLAKSAYVG
jgi:hypothetical protein